MCTNGTSQHQYDAMCLLQAAFEDVEFCVRARKTGVPVTYDADAVVRHHYDFSWLGLFRCGWHPQSRRSTKLGSKASQICVVL